MLKSNRLKNLKNYCTMYKNKFSESGDDRDWRERDWWSLNLLLVIVVIVISLFTLGVFIALMLMGPRKWVKQIIEIKQNGVKNPNLLGGKSAGYLQA